MLCRGVDSVSDGGGGIDVTATAVIGIAAGSTSTGAESAACIVVDSTSSRRLDLDRRIAIAATTPTISSNATTPPTMPAIKAMSMSRELASGLTSPESANAIIVVVAEATSTAASESVVTCVNVSVNVSDKDCDVVGAVVVAVC